MRIKKKKLNMINNLYSKTSVKSFYSLIATFIKKGKKAKALSFFLYVLSCINKQKVEKVSTLAFLQKSLSNIYPEISFRRVGHRKVFYLPKIITEEKKVKIGMN
jgi:ribosomal protein S7